MQYAALSLRVRQPPTSILIPTIKKITVDLPEAKKRQHKSYNCPECNLTFDSKYKMNKHQKEHYDGKNIISRKKTS